MNMNNQEKNSYVREHILDALLDMLEDTEITSVVVSNLVRKAGVGRASFYRNYTSVQDVLIQEERRLFSEWHHAYNQIPESSVLISQKTC